MWRHFWFWLMQRSLFYNRDADSGAAPLRSHILVEGLSRSRISLQWITQCVFPYASCMVSMICILLCLLLPCLSRRLKPSAVDPSDSFIFKLRPERDHYHWTGLTREFIKVSAARVGDFVNEQTASATFLMNDWETRHWLTLFCFQLQFDRNSGIFIGTDG